MTRVIKKEFLSKFFVLLFLITIYPDISHGKTNGEFIGQVIAKFHSDGRSMKLVKPFAYIDPTGHQWNVPKGYVIDGASIPGALWSIIGSPFAGKYRDASVIHDYFVDKKNRHWKAVHKVFLNAMLTSGVSNFKAKLMYLAVYRFGPRWEFDIDTCYCKNCPPCALPKLKRVKFHRPKFISSDFEQLRVRLKKGDLTLQDLEDLADYQLNSQLSK